MPSNQQLIESVRSHGRLGGWAVGKYLGRGGGGALFVGQRRKLDGTMESAALKVLLPTGISDGSLFAHELDVLQRSAIPQAIPYLLSLLDSGVEDVPSPTSPLEIRWFATEFVQGQNLEQDIAEHGILDKQQWLELAHDLLFAVAQLHSAGIIHKDIKPPNIMRFSRRSVLIDVGGASFVNVRDPGDGKSVYSRGFCAPEQITGTHPEDFGYEVDLFAVGCTLAYASTGLTPWDASKRTRRKDGKDFDATDIVYFDNIKSEPPRLSGLDTDQKNLVMKLLQFEPRARGTAVASLEIVKKMLPATSSRKSTTGSENKIFATPQSSPQSKDRTPARILSNNGSQNTETPSDKDWTTVLLLAFFLGWLGIHRFYVNKAGTGLVWFFTYGCFLFGWIIDLCLIATKQFRDGNGKLIIPRKEW
jgi:serine/threonine protein kinase